MNFLLVSETYWRVFTAFWRKFKGGILQVTIHLLQKLSPKFKSYENKIYLPYFSDHPHDVYFL